MRIVQIEHFAARVNESFVLGLPGGVGQDLTLTAARPLPVHEFPGRMRDPFALTFASTSPVVLPQKIYTVTNASMGTFDLFIAPVGREATGVFYEAIFN